MVYFIVISLTLVSVILVTLLFDPKLYSALWSAIITRLNTRGKNTFSLNRLNVGRLNFGKSGLGNDQRVSKASKPAQARSRSNKSDHRLKVEHHRISWLSKHAFVIASSALIAATLGLCYWLVNYASLDVYHDMQASQTAYSPQINQLLLGERLQPPPAPPEALFEELDAQIASANAFRDDSEIWEELTPDTTTFSLPNAGGSATDVQAAASAEEDPPVVDLQALEGGYSSDMLSTHLNNGYINIRNADRNWNKMNSQFVQRLLMIYKIMHDQYGYDMVLLEGYRSPQRQARLLAKGGHVTKAGSYRSYHQFGLAADSAFIRKGKIVISERDPWAMQGYKLYGKVAKSVGLVWGGDWRMKDLGHVELRKKGVLGRPEMAKVLTNQ